MVNNSSLSDAKIAKNDEFYTQYSDIEAEMNAYVEFNPDVFKGKTILLPCDDPEWSNFTRYFAYNFERFGIKKLISTSYVKSAGSKQLTLFEKQSPLYDAELHETCGKLFTLTHDVDGSGNIDIKDVEFNGYLKSDGDFRSEEVCRLRDEADVIITNPPFSLFREFLDWIIKANKQFIILGHQNSVTYKNVFPLLKENKMWYGYSIHSGGIDFRMPDDLQIYSKHVFVRDGKHYINLAGIRWFTNIDHGQRYQKLKLDTMVHNLKFNKKLRKKFENEYGKLEYPRYDNYDAIEVPFTECIPSDYDGVMGVPITYLDKHNPDQFEIIGLSSKKHAGNVKRLHDNSYYNGYTRGKVVTRVESNMPLLNIPFGSGTKCSREGSPDIYQLYWRIFIRKKKEGK